MTGLPVWREWFAVTLRAFNCLNVPRKPTCHILGSGPDIIIILYIIIIIIPSPEVFFQVFFLQLSVVNIS